MRLPLCVTSLENRETPELSYLPGACWGLGFFFAWVGFFVHLFWVVCLFACFVFVLFFNLCYSYIFREGNHQHHLLSQDAFRCVTSDKQAIMSSLPLDHQAEGSCPAA